MAAPEFTELIETCDETVLFCLVEELGAMLSCLRRAAYRPSTSGDEAMSLLGDCAKIAEDSHLAVAQLSRFGIEPFEADGKTPTADYWLWYRWWRDWYKGMTPQDQDRLDAALKAREGTAEMRPNGDWREAKVEVEDGQ